MSKREIRSKIAEVFEKMRREGFQARMNHLRCSSCAGYDLFEKARKLKIKAKGAVYWHGQDEAEFKKKCESQLAIRFLGDSEAYELTRKQVALRLIELFGENGVKTKWSGKENEVVFVVLES